MNKQNLKKSAIYNYLAESTWKSVWTIKAYFNRRKKDVLNSEDVDWYLFKEKFVEQSKHWWIYAIVNKINWREYIWSTANFKNRSSQHYDALKTNTHKNARLQNDFNKQKHSDFEFIILERIIWWSKIELEKAEEIKIYNSKNAYNIEFNIDWYWNSFTFQYNCRVFKQEIAKFLLDKWFINKDWKII